MTTIQYHLFIVLGIENK